ncbi:MAG: Sec-independent protein translocase protein TatB [Azoarcus sp.]|jgi:sec-independent protein translocase protein TatB|nr:Sec-independent protein translocase protein TatB [Azoarcus sp.]
MFDIGFSELVVIGIVLLIVVGPERLPGVARTAGHLLGRLQRYVASVKSDIQREIHLDELRKLRERAHTIDQTLRAEVSEIQTSLTETLTLSSSAEPPEDAPPAAAADAPSSPRREPALDARPLTPADKA